MAGLAVAGQAACRLAAVPSPSIRLQQNAGLSGSTLSGRRLPMPSSRKVEVASKGLVARAQAAAEAEAQTEERFRLNNLGPQPGSRRKEKRKGRGYGAGQGGSCGFGMRGQKSRSGSGVRPGFEGGQIPLYRRLPKLRGIAGGMPSGQQKHVVVNLEDLVNKGVKEGDVVSRESLIADGLIKPSGKQRNLPLKVLGDGDVDVKFTIKAGAFSKTALEKLEKAGCTIETVPGRKKWTKKAYLAEKKKAESS